MELPYAWCKALLFGVLVAVPELVIHRSVVIAAGVPSEHAATWRDLHVIGTDKLILTLCETPGIRRGLELQIALGEKDPFHRTHGEKPPEGVLRLLVFAFRHGEGDFISVTDARVKTYDFTK